MNYLLMETKIWLSTGPLNIKPDSTIKSTRRLHAFCTANSIRDALLKSQGGWYWLQKDNKLRFIDRCLDNITFEEIFNLAKSEEKDFKLQSFSITFNKKNKKGFSVRSNMDEDTFQAAVISWAARTKLFTAESFVDYINSKQSEDYCELIPK